MQSGRRLRSGVLLIIATLVTGVVSGGLWQMRDFWSQGSEISGFARVMDGDSLMVGKTEVRLYGVDAPELIQRCRREDRDVACGREALRTLVALIGGQPVHCIKKAVDRFQRVVATCRSDTVDLGQAMVMSGQAVAFGHYNKEETAARTERKGLWAGEFMTPQEWRRQYGSRVEMGY